MTIEFMVQVHPPDIWKMKDNIEYVVFIDKSRNKFIFILPTAYTFSPIHFIAAVWVSIWLY
jgi:hypothetical protein